MKKKKIVGTVLGCPSGGCDAPVGTSCAQILPSSSALLPLPPQDALRAKRNQEAAERDWRRKEKDALQKKIQTEAMLKQSRLEQVAQKEHNLAVQVQRDRAEFDRIVR